MNALVRIATLAVAITHAACSPSSKPSAADDPQRYVGGSLYLSAEEPARSLGTGPLFLTDVMIDSSMGNIFVTGDPTCKETEPGGHRFDWSTPTDTPPHVESHHGMRLLVPAGKTLCLRSLQGQAKLVWAGFRPR
jgi:hypothetical protein